MTGYITLALQKIKVKEQARKHFDVDELHALGANIQEHGLLTPLLVKPSGDEYDLVAGERRLRAMMLKGIKECKVIVLRDMDAGETEVVQWIENAHRADLLPVEKAHALAGIKQKKGWNNKEIAAHLHMDPSLPTRYLSLFSTVPLVQECAASGKIGPAAWYSIGLAPAELQANLLEQHLSGMSVTQLEKLSRKARSTPAASSSRTRLTRLPIRLSDGASVVISAKGLTMAKVAEILSEISLAAKSACERGLDEHGFSAEMRDKAKKAA
jgi:ParB family chromosome partitioning protein